MGMSGIDHAAADALLGAYLLDALEVDETLAVEEHVSTCEACQTTVDDLGTGIEALARSAAAPTPDDLAGRTLAAARAARPASEHAFEPADVHLVEASRVLALLARLDATQWSASVGPAFPAGWTVHDLAAHLAASEALLAIAVGVDPDTPETEDQPEPRAHAAVARHRQLDPATTIDELRHLYDLVHQAVRALGPDADHRVIAWFGLDLTLGYALTQRAFETWTHADDMRAAVGLEAFPPPAGSVRTMSSAALDMLPLMLAATGVDGTDRWARLTLTGPGGASYDLALDLAAAGAPPVAGSSPDVVIELDSIAFCRAVADRVPADGLPYSAQGDLDLAAGIARALPALAVL
jgi:uncharacterized protein (TIGR03083 family)